MPQNDIVKQNIDSLNNTLSAMSQSQLQNLENSSYNNLKSMLEDPNGAFKNDPELALEAYKTISKTNQGAMETKRRLIDTLIKLKSLDERASVPPSNILPDADESAAGTESNSTFA